jgi:hypothetical protein
VQVVITKSASDNLYWRAPATQASHIEGAKSSILNTGEITLVFYGLHRGNLARRTDISSSHTFI